MVCALPGSHVDLILPSVGLSTIARMPEDRSSEQRRFERPARESADLRAVETTARPVATENPRRLVVGLLSTVTVLAIAVTILSLA